MSRLTHGKLTPVGEPEFTELWDFAVNFEPNWISRCRLIVHTRVGAVIESKPWQIRMVHRTRSTLDWHTGRQLEHGRPHHILEGQILVEWHRHQR